MATERSVQDLVASWGGVADLDLIASPFDGLPRELVEWANIVVDCSRQNMKSPWEKRAFRVIFVNNIRANACATKDEEMDYVLITTGLIERVYGTMGGIMSVRSSMPPIGSPNAEGPVLSDLRDGFPRLPLFTKESVLSSDSIDICWPLDVGRAAFGMQLSSMALQFALTHEIGHIFAGHLEMLEAHGISPMTHEFGVQKGGSCAVPPLHVCECDADTFASHLQSFIDLHPETLGFWSETYGWGDVPGQDAGFIAHAIAVCVLFRLFDMLSGDGLAPKHNEVTRHPHPAVRSNMAISRSFALAVDAGRFTVEDLPRLVNASLIPVEELWQTLRLPGQRLGLQSEWRTQIKRLCGELDRDYQQCQPVLRTFSRVHPQWHTCWPRQ